jgi:outer membrane protein assembly factor BamB
MRSAALWIIPTVLALATAASAAPPNLRTLSPAAIQQFGGWGADEYERQFKDPPVKFSVDVNNGVGFYEGGDGIIGLPAKDLSDEAVSKAARSPAGAPVCRISMSQRFQLVVDGKPVSRNRVHHLRSVSVDGLEHWTAVFSCAIKEKTGGERELWVYGKDQEPIYKAPFKPSVSQRLDRAVAGSSGALALEAASVGDEKLVLDVKLLGKYVAELELWCGESVSPEDFPATTTTESTSALSPPRRATVAGQGAKPADFGAIQFGSERAGYLADGSNLPKRPRVLWTFPPGANGSPFGIGDPIVQQGIVYFGDAKGSLHALNAESGQEQWTRGYGHDLILAAPTIADGRIYVASAGGVTCASLDGNPIWSRELPQSFGGTWPLLVGDALFAAGGDGRIYAIKKQDGAVIWSADVLADRPADLYGFDSSPFLRDGIGARIQSSASDGETLYQNVFDQSRMIALDCRTGTRRWTYRAHAWLYSHPVIADNYVLTGSEDLCVHCLDRRSGKLAWKKMTGGIVAAAPAVVNGRVYAPICNGLVLCLDLETGKLIWSHRQDPPFDGNRFCYCAPIVTNDAVYVAASNGKVYALDASTGEACWGIFVVKGSELATYNMATDGKRLFAVTRNRPYRLPVGRFSLFAIGD